MSKYHVDFVVDSIGEAGKREERRSFTARDHHDAIRQVGEMLENEQAVLHNANVIVLRCEGSVVRSRDLSADEWNSDSTPASEDS